jgi:iron complex outermembrane receptor protein
MKFKLSALTIATISIFNTSFINAQPVTEFGSIIVDDKELKAKDLQSVKTSPVQATLDVSRPVVELPKDYFDNNIYPTDSWATAASMIAPSMFAIPFNGPGGGDEKISIRGFADASDTFTMQFDGIPFSDTNDPSHHSQVFFPSPFIGSMVIDRSPGGASTLGTANYGGVIGIISKPLTEKQEATLYGNYGSFNTSLVGGEFQTGSLGDHNTRMFFNVHTAKSDGYLTSFYTHRDAGDFKLQSDLTRDTQLTVFLSTLTWRTNSTDYPGQLAVNALPNAPYNLTHTSLYKSDDYFQQSTDPTQKNYTGYNNQTVSTLFNYIGINSNLGSGWKLDDKLYYLSYNNQEYYTTNTDASSNAYAGSTRGGLDKLNSYETVGNITRLTLDTQSGVLRTGLWLQNSNTNRHQLYMDVGSGTYANTSLVQNTKVNQNFSQVTVQPYAEYEWKATDSLRVTPGIKYNIYQIGMNNMPSTKTCTYNSTTPISNCASNIASATYNDVLPFLDARYFIQKNWNVYGQFAKGDVIPSSSVLDVAGNVTTPPPPVRTNTFQTGTVYQSSKVMLDFDIYYTHADSSYTSVPDGNGGYAYIPSDAVIYKGVEGQANYILGAGFNIYGNASLLRANYDNAAGLSAAYVPNDMETLALMYKKDKINTSISVKRIGSMWVDSSSGNHQFYQLDPIYLTNLIFNYTFDSVPGFAKSIKVKAGIDNIFNQRYITAYTPGSTIVGSAPGTTTTDTIQMNSGRAMFVGLEAKF